MIGLLSDISLEIFRAVVVGVVLIYLSIVDKRNKLHKQSGWLYILAGFGLLFFGAVIDISDNFPALNRCIIIGDTECEAFLEKTAGYTLGPLLLAVGFWKWLPAVLALRETKDKLDESERYFRSLIENSFDIITVLDRDGVVLFESPSIERIFGYKPEELTGKNVFQFIHPEDAEAVQRAYNSGLQQPGVYIQQELRFLHKDGTWRIIEAVGKYAPYPSPGRVIINSRDITERKKAEEEVRSLSARYKAILAAVPDIIMEVDGNRLYTWANSAGFEFFGDDVIGKEASFYFEGEQETYSAVQPLFSGSEDVIYVESWQRRKDGERCLLAWWCRVLKDASGTVIGALSTARDITESRGAEEALGCSEEKYRDLFENANDAICILDSSLKYIDVNKKAVEMFGYSREELLEMNVIDLIPSEQIQSSTMEFEKLQREGKYEKFLGKIRRKDGLHIDVEVSSSAIMDGDTVIGSRDIIRDVTERKKLEVQLLQSQKMEAIGQLAGGVAHDFNNILTAIVGYANLMQMKIEDDDTLRIDLDNILEASERAASLIHSLLAFSRKQATNPDVLDVKALLRNFEKFVLRLIREDIEIKTVCAEPGLLVMVDRGQIEQALMNLVTNARDAMPGGGRLTVTARRVGRSEIGDSDMYGHRVYSELTDHYSEPREDFVEISVADTGIGMDEAVKSKIFNPFFTTKEQGKGTGLGLSMVYGVIKKHDGFIDVISEAGKGSIFKIYLPLTKTPLKVGGKFKTEADPVRGGAETILIAEDDPVILELSKTVLGSVGYKVIEAVDGEDAAAKFAASSDDIQLVILDGIMPKKSGREAYEGMRQIKPGIKAMFVSGYSEDIFNSKELTNENVSFLQKPVKPYDLLKKVREVLDNKAG